ncbi:polysaccharide biosynthesis/export family protein [Methylomicrobium sp. RS1]|uniref:polysaccharide biosynthesis/export family protein n=1 Tax=Candidatus Methylomicrobium oryzae TaxID=2802053 RepID=UPI001924B726|nr:polysaccharide biosynthesis/export family protein [Methylomicrobium sp. RS1]MBL1262358.1 polysaccharide export protein [Methylomicrobium sp. RS1]
MSNYELGAGDKIMITVFREPDLTLEAKLTDAGTIIFPFLGEMNVKGLTVGRLKDKITQSLSGRYLKDPRVTVSVLEYREFFVNGEVNRPGAFPYLPGLTVQKAISIAGGFTERASQSSVLLEREKDVARQGIEVELDAPIAPGDVVIVEESFF